jgi:hypothetical protein
MCTDERNVCEDSINSSARPTRAVCRIKIQEQRAVALIATKGQELVFGFSFEEGTNILRLTHKDQPIIPDAACKLMLEPFLFNSGSRSSLNPPAT